MKRTAVLVAAFFAASLTQAQMQPAATTAGTTVAKPDAAKNVPAKKKEEMGKIPGVTIPRSDGTFLGLEVVGTKFKLTFYNKMKKPASVDVTRATARWPNTRSASVSFNFTVLNPAGKSTLVGLKPVLPPYAWNVFLTLLQGEGDDAKVVEAHTVPFHQ